MKIGSPHKCEDPIFIKPAVSTASNVYGLVHIETGIVYSLFHCFRIYIPLHYCNTGGEINGHILGTLKG